MTELTGIETNLVLDELRLVYVNVNNKDTGKELAGGPLCTLETVEESETGEQVSELEQNNDALC